jgi:hypothetical protein
VHDAVPLNGKRNRDVHEYLQICVNHVSQELKQLTLACKDGTAQRQAVGVLEQQLLSSERAVEASQGRTEALEQELHALNASHAEKFAVAANLYALNGLELLSSALQPHKSPFVRGVTQ